MRTEELERRREKLARDITHRYQQRARARNEYHERLDKAGVFAAAGPVATTRRAGHMSIADSRAMSRPREKGRINEAIIGPDDTDSVNFLARGMLAARTVCRLVQNGQPIGTGFLVAPGLLLTNNHVIDSASEANTFVAEFDFELDSNDQPRTPIIRFGLDPDRYFVTSDSELGLDFTFVGMKPTSIETKISIDEFGWIPMDPISDKILVGEPAIVIQHPRGEMKRLSLFASEIVDKFDDYLQSVADTDKGSSGSCVFNRSWQLVALHHASTTTDERKRGLPTIVNEGIRVSAIVRALGQPEFGENGARVLRVISDPKIIGDGRPQAPRRASPAPVGGGTPGYVREPAARVFESTIGRRPATFFRDRAEAHFGYKPEFLGEHLAVPLPRLPDALASDAAVDADGSSELKYTHFSIMFSASRKLPIFSAVNIDGKTSLKLKRTDRELEAADKWFYDPRIAQELQLEPEIYDRTEFDFGHQTRREDPIWGDEDTARMANDDTFYMTNCAPQHHDLNTRTWLQLENAILEAARSNKRKVSVFTGPVLSPQDPSVLGVQVPTAFWKIVAYVDHGSLRAHGFIQYQTQLVHDIRVRPESLDGLEKAAEYQVRIADIARVTALDFGRLVDADELRNGQRRRITESLTKTLFVPGGEPSEVISTPAQPISAVVAGPKPIIEVDAQYSTTTTGEPADFLAGMHEIAVGLAKLAPLVERLASPPPLRH